MKNVKMSVTGSVLTITINLNEKGELSASGKSELIASTQGNPSVPGNETIKIGLNMYRSVSASGGKVRRIG